MTRFTRTLGIFLMLLAPFVGSTMAQTSNGTLVGTVVDPTGAALQGASVSIQSVDTGAVRTAQTISNGSYRIESLLPGTYTVTVKAPNFQSTVVKGLYIAGSVVTTGDVTLKLGNATEQVEVVANAITVNTDNAQISGQIGTEEISALPFSSLSPYSLALTLPGVTSVTQGGTSNGVSFSVAGGRPRTNNFLIEGQDNNDAALHGQGLQPENVEAQKEVTVIENNFTSEYGHGAGSVSNLIFKSGSNQLHGSVYERALNSSLDSTSHYDVRNKIKKGLYRENLFGFTIGGPVIKNKVFGFGSYQWDKYRATANLSTLTVPSAAGYATLKALPTNTRISNLIAAYAGLVGDPVRLAAAGGQNTIALGPDPVTGLDRGTVQIGYTQRSLGNSSEGPELDLKGDYLINTNDTMTLRYIKSSFSTPYDTGNSPGQLPGFDSAQNGVAQNAGIVETHIFNANLLNEFRLSYGRIGFNFTLPASTTSNKLFGTPGVSISSLTGYGIPTNVPQGRFHNTYQVQDSISWTRGKHTMKFGADIADIRVMDQIPFNFYGTISYATVLASATIPTTTTGLANYIDDFGGKGSINQNFGSPTARPRMVSQNYFAQDSWKAMQNLSIDYGIRYEYNGAPFNAPGTPYPGIDLNNPACYPSGTTTCNMKETPDTKDWGPRVGIAYSPTWWGQYQTVVRLGAGMFYDGLFTNIIDNIQAAAPNNSSKTINSLPSATLPRGFANWSTYTAFTGVSKAPLATDTANPILDHLVSPKTFHWNLNVQQEFPKGFVAQVSYVGERGEHLYGQTEFNPYLNNVFGSTTRLFNSRGRIILRDNSEDSNYNGLWAQLDKKMTNHLLFRAAYTYARAMDDGSEIFTYNNESSYASASYPANRKLTDYGLSEYDHRQRLVLSYVISPPVLHTEGAMQIVGNVINHWSIAGITQFQSGTPENVETGYDTNGDGITNDRPILSNPKAPLATYAWDDSWQYGTSHGTYCSGPSFWYTSLPCEAVSPSSVHWIVPYIATRPNNTVGRNNLISPGFQQWDMNIQRSFKIWRESTLDVRGEFFNIFNHGNAGIEPTTLITGINTDAYSSNGGNTFANPTNTVDGYRNARIYIRIAF